MNNRNEIIEIISGVRRTLSTIMPQIIEQEKKLGAWAGPEFETPNVAFWKGHMGALRGTVQHIIQSMDEFLALVDQNNELGALISKLERQMAEEN